MFRRGRGPGWGGVRGGEEVSASARPQNSTHLWNFHEEYSKNSVTYEFLSVENFQGIQGEVPWLGRTGLEMADYVSFHRLKRSHTCTYTCRLHSCVHAVSFSMSIIVQNKTKTKNPTKPRKTMIWKECFKLNLPFSRSALSVKVSLKRYCLGFGFGK